MADPQLLVRSLNAGRQTWNPILLLAALGTACGLGTPANGRGDGVIPAVLVSQLDPADWANDPFTLEDARFTGDTLELEVAYAGGCRQHEFKLVVSTSFMESDPVRTRSLLSHDANGDGCEAALHAELRADLSPLKAAWQNSYQRPSGVILLLIDDAEELRYSF